MPYARTDGPRLHFVSNVDGAAIHTWPEPGHHVPGGFEDAHHARDDDQRPLALTWLCCPGRRSRWRHFVALSTNLTAVEAFGIDPSNVFAFWDWVGGRYSLWSAIGLSIALAVGFERFEELLEGAYAVDEHFRRAPLATNVPVLMGLLNVWYGNFWDAETWAVLPYDESLTYPPTYSKQHGVERQERHAGREACDVADAQWCGSTRQSTHQRLLQPLHQGTKLIPADFIVVATPQHPSPSTTTSSSQTS